MTPRPPHPVTVSGGSGGITANRGDILALGLRFDAAAEAVAGVRHGVRALAASPLPAGHGFFDDTGLDAGADRVHLAEFVALVATGLRVLDGAELRCRVIARGATRAAVDYERLDHLFGTGPLGLLMRTLHGLAGIDAVLFATHSPSRALGCAVTADPDATVALVVGTGAVTAADVLVARARDGRGVARDDGLDAAGAGAVVPRRLGDVLTDLATRNDDERHGEIDVRVLTMPDGSRRAIVDITGTKSWSPQPGPDVTDLTTNVRALAGARTAYEQGVLAAMRAAGVRRGDDVMLVGHSQGGMIAVNTARDAARTGEFHVTHVITAGAPIGTLVGRVPAGTAVLALENQHDVVPHLDRAANPDRPNVTTVVVHRNSCSVTGNHGLDDTYVPAAADVQRSDERSVRDFLAGARGYFGARHVATHTFQIERR